MEYQGSELPLRRIGILSSPIAVLCPTSPPLWPLCRAAMKHPV